VVHTGFKFLNLSENIIYAIYHSVKSISLVAALAILLPIVSIAHAQDLLEANKEDKDFGNSALGKLHIPVRPYMDDKIGSQINYKGTNLPELKYSSGNMQDAAREKADSKIGKIISTGFIRKKEFKVTSKDSFLDKANHAQANPEEYVNWLTGKYEDCVQEPEASFSKEVKTCDEYQEIKEQSCHVGRLIEVDAKHNYECLRKREKFAKVCIKTLNVTVEETQNCDGGNISWISGGSFKAEYPNIFISPSYEAMTVSSQCSRGIPYGATLAPKEPDGFKSVITFQVEDLSLLKELTLTSLNYYYPLEVTVNGAVVYASSASNSLKVIGKTRHRSGDFDFGFVDKGQFYSLDYLSRMEVKNIRPSLNILGYIKPGYNTIAFRSLVSKPVTAVLHTKQNCKLEVDHWSEVCRESKIAP
jgi:hypothetical protein